MRQGWLNRLRLHRRWVIHAVMLVLVAPALLGILPQPATSAAALLERDLALSLCSSGGPDSMPGQGQLPSHSDCCVLCSACATISGRSPGDAITAFAAPARTVAPAIHLATAHLKPPQSLLLYGSPPRGPPSLLLV
jgi:hypothetical protein